MKKRLKIALCCLLTIAIIAVLYLMFGLPKQETSDKEPTNEPIIGQENTENIENSENTDTETPTFEEDVMKDLEGFFNSNNGYEDIQGEYGFTDSENE